jgi:hypothetical protein
LDAKAGERFVVAQTVVAYRTDLIGGRLLNLMHGWRLARRLEADFVHLWPLFTKWREQSGYRDPAASLSQLFDLAEHALARPDLRFTTIDGLTVREAVELARQRLRALPAAPDDLAVYPFAPKADDVRDHWPSAAFTASTPFPLAGDDPATVRAEATALIRSLPLSAALAAALERVHQLADLDEAVTVNLRRGDVVGLIAGASGRSDDEIRKYAGLFVSRYAPESAYEAALAAWPRRPILVFSDDLAVAAAFAGRHPGAIDGRALIAPAAAGLTPLQADMLQVLTMGETQAILGSGSNFAIASAYYGGRPYDDLRGHWTATTVIETLDEVFPGAPARIIAALLDAFDAWFATRPDLAAERAALSAERNARLAACPA